MYITCLTLLTREITQSIRHVLATNVPQTGNHKLHHVDITWLSSSPFREEIGRRSARACEILSAFEHFFPSAAQTYGQYLPLLSVQLLYDSIDDDIIQDSGGFWR